MLIKLPNASKHHVRKEDNLSVYFINEFKRFLRRPRKNSIYEKLRGTLALFYKYSPAKLYRQALSTRNKFVKKIRQRLFVFLAMPIFFKKTHFLSYKLGVICSFHTFVISF